MTAAAAIRAAKKRLRGSWRSDKARTMAQWKFSKPITPKRRREFARIFGKNVWRFSAKTCSGRFESLRWTARYKVLWANEHSAVVHLTEGDETRCYHLFFEGNHFYFPCGYAGSVEYFRRMPSNSAFERTTEGRRSAALRSATAAAQRGR